MNLEYERFDAGLSYGVTHSSDYIAMNPNGTVPTLQDGGGDSIWETGAILRYLCERYAPDTFWPADLIAKAQVDKWAEWAKINVAMKFTAPIFWQVVRTAPAQQNPEAIASALATLGRSLDIAEARLTRFPYLAGESFTLADIQFGHCLYRYFNIDLARPSHPAIERYYNALTRRYAFQEYVMVSYEELRATG